MAYFGWFAQQMGPDAPNERGLWGAHAPEALFLLKLFLRCTFKVSSTALHMLRPLSRWIPLPNKMKK
jgi:hypothetical protein